MTDLRDTIMQKLHRKDVFAEIDFVLRKPSAPQGWAGDHPSLSRLGAAASCVIDVGVWKGDSTITLARAIKNAGHDGCVVAVDTFLGSLEHYVDPRFSSLFECKFGRPDLYETFLSNVIHANVQDVVVPLPQTSITAAAILKAVGIAPNLIHIDAAHEYEDVLRDSQAYWDLLAPHGYLIGDDYTSLWPGIIKAAGEFSAAQLRPLSIESPKWILQKAG